MSARHGAVLGSKTVKQFKTQIYDVSQMPHPIMERGRFRLPHVQRALGKDHHGANPSQPKPETWKAQKLA